MSLILSKTGGLAKEIFQKVFKPVEKLNVWQWSEKYITLPETFSSMPGKYDANYTPFWKPVFEAMTDHRVRRLTILKSVQIGGTQMILNSLLYASANIGLPMMYVGQTEDDVKEFSTTKLHPLIETTKPVLDISPPPQKRKITSIPFRTVPLFIGWGSSVKKLASKNVGFLMLDEVDKYEHKVKNETHPYYLALRRTDAFKGREKIIINSTPTDLAGKIWESYLEGSMHVFHFTCPECGKEQPFEHEAETLRDRLKWDPSAKKENGKWDLEKVEKSAYYVCSHCKYEISQDLKPGLIKNGRFVQTNPDAPSDHLSFHINKFISPLPTSWGIIARSFLERKGSPDGLRDFYTQDLGVPFVEQAFSNSEKTIEELLQFSPEYKRGEIPFHPKYCMMTIDVQQKSFWWMKTAWTEEGDCAIIDWGQAFSWAGLRKIMYQRHSCHVDSQKYLFTTGIVDSGYDTKEVYEMCSRERGLNPSKGEGRRLPGGLTECKKMVFKKKQMYLYRYEDYTMKKWVLQARLQGDSDNDGVIMIPRDYNIKLEGEEEPDSLAVQLIDERMVQVVKAGKPVMAFQSKDPSRPNNHLADCLKMAHVGWYHASPHSKTPDEDEVES